MNTSDDAIVVAIAQKALRAYEVVEDSLALNGGRKVRYLLDRHFVSYGQTRAFKCSSFMQRFIVKHLTISSQSGR